MKLSNLLLVTLTSVSLLASGTALAEKKSNQHFISKQPYHELPATDAYNADDQWEGATLVNKDAPTEEVTAKPHLRLHSLGKRPYLEKSEKE
jgi:hypothetical protein